MTHAAVGVPRSRPPVGPEDGGRLAGGVIRYAQALAKQESDDKTLYLGTERMYSDNIDERIGVKRLKELLRHSQLTLFARTDKKLMTITQGYLIKQGEKPEEMFE